MIWLSTRPTSYWQQGCDDGKAGKPRREPGTPGIADMANIGYMNDWHFGRQQRLKEQTAAGVARLDGSTKTAHPPMDSEPTK